MLMDQQRVLKVNRRWRPIMVERTREAFKNLSKGTHHVLYMLYKTDENGKSILNEVEHLTFVDFPTWLTLQGRDCDVWAGTGTSSIYGNTRIRVPTVIMAMNYEDEQVRDANFNFDTLWVRDNGTCQWTGKKLKSKSEANIDHIIPQSKGGKTTWENCVICDKSINTRKGDTMPKDFAKKYKLDIPRPSKPSPIVVATSIVNRYNIPDWNYFL